MHEYEVTYIMWTLQFVETNEVSYSDEIVLLLFLFRSSKLEYFHLHSVIFIEVCILLL